MINHARTLLLNRSGESQNLRDTGEEFIPGVFRSIAVPPWMASIRTAIFGSNPENVYLNYAVDRLLRVVHATDYADYMITFDSRITYDPASIGDFAKSIYGLTWKDSNPAAAVASVSVIGDLAANETVGIMRQRWTVSLVDGVATSLETRSRAQSQQYIRDGASLLSLPLSLPDSQLSVRLQMTSAAEADWDANLDLTAMLEPRRSLCEIVDTVEQLHGDALNSLFGAATREPYRTFQRLWSRSFALPERVSGIALALIYRSHELWLAQGSEPVETVFEA